MKPGESENDIFSTTAHNVEEMFLGNPFNVCIQGVDIMYSTSLVHSLVHVSNCNGGDKFLDRELVFSDELPVNARDVHIRVY